MKYLLDTCVLSELIKPQPNIYVNEWMSKFNEADMLISVFTIGELRKGIDKLAIGKRRQKLNLWFQDIMNWGDRRILAFDKASAKNWGMLLAQLEAKGRPIPIVDSMIAAIALTHECTVVTRNVNDFLDIDIPVVNPWDKVLAGSS
jgi:predicted nucleic acid-binding protein